MLSLGFGQEPTVCWLQSRPMEAWSRASEGGVEEGGGTTCLWQAREGRSRVRRWPDPLSPCATVEVRAPPSSTPADAPPPRSRLQIDLEREEMRDGVRG
jgi:hypothetical protein